MRNLNQTKMRFILDITTLSSFNISETNMNDDSIAKDERFSHIAKDPRFKKLPKHERKIKIDKRFKSMFHDEKFKIKFSVDKRGRPVKLSSKENLKKYYDISSSDDEDENGMASERKKSGEKVKDIASPVASSSSEASDSAHEDRIVDLARGEGAMLSSSDDTSSAEGNTLKLFIGVAAV